MNLVFLRLNLKIEHIYTQKKVVTNKTNSSRNNKLIEWMIMK